MNPLLWIMLGSAALLLRIGLAFYHGGLARSKNAGATVFRAMAEMAVGLLAFWAVGAAVLHGQWRGVFARDSMEDEHFFLVAMLVLVGPAVIAGATLERCRLRVVLAGALLMTAVVTPLAWRWAWSPWLSRQGFSDSAGASFLHWAAALAAAVAARAVGPRQGKYNRDGSTNVFMGHNLPLVSTGALVIFAVWGPSLAGFLLLRGPGSPPAWALFNPILAGAGAMVAAMLYCQIHHAKLDMALIYAGLLGGLVSMTAGPERVSPALALLTGAVAGIFVPLAVVRIELLWKIDDPAGGIAIHGVGGFWSAIALAFFAPGTAMQHLHRLVIQSLGLAGIALLSLALATLVFGSMRLAGSLRYPEAEEFDGLDLTDHDINAYPDFQQTLIKSYHLREI